MLDADNFIKVDITSLDFMRDIHSWRWCWASGKRYMVVGLGVSITCTLDLSTWLITRHLSTFVLVALYTLLCYVLFHFTIIVLGRRRCVCMGHERF